MLCVISQSPNVLSNQKSKRFKAIQFIIMYDKERPKILFKKYNYSIIKIVNNNLIINL